MRWLRRCRRGSKLLICCWSGCLVCMGCGRGRKRHFELGIILVLFAMLAACAKAPDQSVASPRAARKKAHAIYQEVAGQMGNVSAEPAKQEEGRVKELISDGERFLEGGRSAAAIDALSLAVELGRSETDSGQQFSKARFLLAEAYFAEGQLSSARRWFRSVAESSAGSVQEPYMGRSIARLVDVMVGMQEVSPLSELLSLADRRQAEKNTPELAYARAKILLVLERYGEASREARSITSKSLLGMRAGYLRGVALMKQAQENAPPLDYSAAVREFEEVAGLSRDVQSTATRKIGDLARLAMARLYYETARFYDAAKSYRQIEGDSEYYSTALFEMAWTYVRMGDHRRAERSLEVLSKQNVEQIDSSEASLLRADLMLRSGRFKEAEALYEETRAAYAPWLERLEQFLARHQDSAIYYDQLLGDQIEGRGELPRQVVAWAREEVLENRGFTLVDEVTRAERLLESSERLQRLSQAVLSSGARVRAFPALERELKEAATLLNELTRARGILAEGLDLTKGRAKGRLARIRARRRDLTSNASRLPVSQEDFEARLGAEKRRAEDLERELQRVQLTVDQMQALINGLKRVLWDAKQGLVSFSEARKSEFARELSLAKEELDGYRKELDQIRNQLAMTRQRIGFGGAQADKDEALRQELKKLFAQEISLTVDGLDKKRRTQKYAERVQPLLEKISRVETELSAVKKQLEEKVAKRSQELSTRLLEESRLLTRYSEQLDELDDSARQLVGEAARNGFVAVFERLSNVVTRADVGLVQKSWEVREEQRRRVRRLQRERARQRRGVYTELQEVLDGSGGGP